MGNRLFNNNIMPTSNTKEAKSVNNYSKSSSQINAKTMDVFMNTDDHGLLTNVDNNKISSQDGESMDESTATINCEPEQLTDFEKMIDSLRENEVKKTLNNIKEFENVLSSFDTIKNKNETIIDLDEIYDYLELGIDNDDVNLINAPEILGINEEDNLKTISKFNIDDNAQETNNNYNLDIMENIRNAVTVDKLRNDFNEMSKKHVKVKFASEVPVHNIDLNSTGEVFKVDSDNVQEKDDKIVHTLIAVGSKENSLRTIKEMNNNDANIKDFSEKSKENVDTVANDASLSNNPIKYISNVMESEADIIILSSDDEIEAHLDEEENDGYHSSDFEFITEEEANLDGFIINFKRKDPNNSKTDDDSNKNNNNSNDNSQRSQDEDGNLQSSLEGRSLRKYRENHVIPEGEDYLNLFQLQLNPVVPLTDIIFMENKSIRPSPMNAQYEGMGFDNQLIARRHRRDSSEEEYADEAKENIKMILSLYPNENRRVRKRRRHH